ncbi:MAG: hypothetical protein QN152_01460 [Armatimonadota bacterium]|nr:hypothetical protein [Armatimonadota bacterium]MDR7463669.1 hypothetical protein [Armatimonadota bacterium]MDR7468680.1 hypothetical protein [Armatimonadota bacterium]MDR7538186.1 hypothetical protein [Armatimonadota bacterium]
MNRHASATLRTLLSRVALLEQQVARMAPTVDATLRHRGWPAAVHSRDDRLLLPHPASQALIDRYYADLRHYHFRRILQEAAERRRLGPVAVRRLVERWGPRSATTLDRLVEYGLLTRRGKGFVLTAEETKTFGETLEWFVAQVFAREFAAPAAWDVRVRGLERGGDFDVLVVLDGRLGYVECKGSPPYNVSADVLARYLERTRHLGPDFTILLLDTTLRIERNIIDNLVRLLRGGGEPPQVLRVTPGVYEVAGGIPSFVVTSRRSLVANLAVCLRRLHGAR